MPALSVTKSCLWCGCDMNTTRSDKRFCSIKCRNAAAYEHRTNWDWLTKDEFIQVINNHIEKGTHVNPDHPLIAIDNALTEVKRSIKTLLNLTTGEIKQ